MSWGATVERSPGTPSTNTSGLRGPVIVVVPRRLISEPRRGSPFAVVTARPGILPSIRDAASRAGAWTNSSALTLATAPVISSRRCVP